MSGSAKRLLRPLLIAGPSGAGKGTLINNFLFRDPVFASHVGFSVSHTTRKKRDGEEDGVHYHFVASEKEMFAFEQSTSKLVGASVPFFIETAYVHGNHYGTSFDAVRRVQEAGKICVLDVDIQGVRSIKQSNVLATNSVFISPPLALLEERLRGRGSETEDSLRIRLANAEIELSEAQAAGQSLFDDVLIADTTAEVYAMLKPRLEEWYPRISRAEHGDV